MKINERFNDGAEGLEQQSNSEEDVLGSMPPFKEHMKGVEERIQLKKTMILYESICCWPNGDDRENVKNAIEAALQEGNGKTLFDNLCLKLDEEYASEDHDTENDYDFGAYDAAYTLIEANVSRVIAENQDKEVGYAEGLLFKNRMIQRLAHPKIFAQFATDEMFLNDIVDRYRNGRENGSIEQSFKDYLESMSTGYGLYEEAAINGRGNHLNPKQRAEWQAINRALKELELTKDSDSRANRMLPLEDAFVIKEEEANHQDVPQDEWVSPSVGSPIDEVETPDSKPLANNEFLIDEEMPDDDISTESYAPSTTEVANRVAENTEIPDSNVATEKNADETEREKRQRIEKIQEARKIIFMLSNAARGSKSAMNASRELGQYNQRMEQLIYDGSDGAEDEIKRLTNESTKRVLFLRNVKFGKLPRQFAPAIEACNKVLRLLSEI